MARVLAIPDLHAPFLHKDTWDFLADVRKQYRPDTTVFLGDLGDQYRLSRHTQEPEAKGVVSELAAARRALEPGYKLFPKAKVTWGNHDLRLAKRATEAGIPQECLKSYADIMGSPKAWEFADFYQIDGVRYLHGDGLCGLHAAYNAAIKYRQSVVIGHLHSNGGIKYSANPNGRIWGMSAGALVDETAYCFNYGKNNPNDAVLGCGVVIDSVPHFIPMAS